MKKEEYIYIGLYNGQRIFYDEVKEKFYVGKSTYNGSLKQAAIFAFVSSLIYMMGRGMKLESLNLPITLFVIGSALVGVILAVICSRHVDSANKAFFNNAQPLAAVEKGYLDQLLKQSGRITMGYIYLRIILILLVIFEPGLIQELKDPILLVTYFMIWFACCYMFIQFNISKRMRIINKLKKQI